LGIGTTSKTLPLLKISNMDYDLYRQNLSELNFGKKVNNNLYIHIESLSKHNHQLFNFVENIRNSVKDTQDFNVLKFAVSQFRISFLSYLSFFETPHPTLQFSSTINLATGKIRRFNYSKSDNPPILHRKETLLEPEHRLIPKFKALTEAEEAEGLYENTKIIGFKRNWDRLLAEKGLSYKGHKLIKRKPPKTPSPSCDIKVKRHKTAIARYNFSKPIQTILEYNLLEEKATLFDYGCGHGDDIQALQKMGVEANGWDPVYHTDARKSESDIVNLGFVLNVIEDQTERTSVLREAYDLSNKLLVVSSMIATSSTGDKGRPFKDGILTNRGTFQKYYDQDELRQYIEDALENNAVAVRPGIFYVFRSPIDQQEFLSNRSKRAINWFEISKKFYPERAERIRLQKEELYEKHKDLLDSFWNMLIDLGRLPKKHEFEGYDELREKFGTPDSAKKFFIEKFGEQTLNETFEVRRNDLLVYMALSNFKRKVPFNHLSPRLQADIKTFLGSYSSGLEESKAMLFAIGNPDVITELCNKTQFGFFDHKALYIHKSLVDKLHPVLRIYIGCSGILYGDTQNADIIKIHRWSGKVTLLKYDDFENSPLPELHERVKVNLRKQHIDVFDHQSPTHQQLLYFKEFYVGKDHPSLPKWEKFSNKLRKLGFDDNAAFGPSKKEFLELIEQKGLTPNLNKKRKTK